MNKFLICIFFIYISINVNAEEKLIGSLKDGQKIIFIRHALAPGSGDPENFNLNDCSTQRNLNQSGINQSSKIGSFFLENNIPIDKVLSSEWCRCKETAKFAFDKFETFNALNSFYSKKFEKNKNKQIKDLKNYINQWDGKKNLILVTHYVVILEMINLTTSSGEIVIVDKKLNFIGRMKINS
tara:strand:+ start:4747 stop:5295 length:549 start_codon:yes stop_codon:yes gene_type:complete